MLMVLVGQLLAFFDLRVGMTVGPIDARIDLLPDPLGWAITAYALTQLAHRSSFFTWAADCGAVTAFVSLVDWFSPYHRVDIRDAGDLAVTDLLGMTLVYELAAAATVVLALFGLREAAIRAGAHAPASTFETLLAVMMALELGGLVAPVMLFLANLPLPAGLVLLAFAVGLLATYIWWLALLWMHRHAVWLAAEPTPYDDPVPPQHPYTYE